MIWLNEQNIALIGPQLPDVTIDGTQWHVFDVYKKTAVGNWNRIAFERVTPVTSVSNLDVAPFVQAAISDGAIAPDWYQQDLESGFEIWYGGVGLTTYSFSANPPTLTPLSGTGQRRHRRAGPVAWAATVVPDRAPPGRRRWRGAGQPSAWPYRSVRRRSPRGRVRLCVEPRAPGATWSAWPPTTRQSRE